MNGPRGRPARIAVPNSRVPLPIKAQNRRAREQGRSLNDVALETLARGAGFAEHPSPRRDLGDIAGTWRNDRAFDRALADQHRVDRALWK